MQNSEAEELINQLIIEAKRLYDQKLISGSSGNISFKKDNKIYISATGTNLGKLSSNDIAIVKLNGEVLFNKPSKEIMGHKALYEVHDDVNAVLHIHGEYIAAYTVITEAGNSDFPAVSASVPLKIAENIPMMEYFHPHPINNYEIFLKTAKQSKIFFHQNHGIFIGASSLQEASDIAEVLEANLKIYFLALQTGRKINLLTAQQKNELFTKTFLK
jgi:3-dehydro-4-phosphotetronate decarboxylase